MSQKFQLDPGETLIGSGTMAYKHRKAITREPTRGTIYVTDRRISYYESWSNYVYMDLPLARVRGYKAVKAMLVTYVVIVADDGTQYQFSGFPAKNLQAWLDQVGVQRLEK